MCRQHQFPRLHNGVCCAIECVAIAYVVFGSSRPEFDNAFPHIEERFVGSIPACLSTSAIHRIETNDFMGVSNERIVRCTCI
jgi:hypothetical protein